jgi:uncharacterized protein (DUF433 family)
LGDFGKRSRSAAHLQVNSQICGAGEPATLREVQQIALVKLDLLAMATKTLDHRIVETSGICGGKPRIDGHRITVQNIAIWHDRLGWSADEIASEYDLDLSDIYAALSYYFANREEIDDSIEAGETFAEKLRQETPSLLQQKLEGKA